MNVGLNVGAVGETELSDGERRRDERVSQSVAGAGDARGVIRGGGGGGREPTRQAHGAGREIKVVKVAPVHGARLTRLPGGRGRLGAFP